MLSLFLPVLEYLFLSHTHTTPACPTSGPTRRCNPSCQPLLAYTLVSVSSFVFGKKGSAGSAIHPLPALSTFLPFLAHFLRGPQTPAKVCVVCVSGTSGSASTDVPNLTVLHSPYPSVGESAGTFVSTLSLSLSVCLFSETRLFASTIILSFIPFAGPCTGPSFLALFCSFCLIPLLVPTTLIARPVVPLNLFFFFPPLL
ncbi:hypothetical protein VTK73DRAFT_350 [Phialemonium thermophilum]|uniref:Uncharacterized protein n=1 Tax=Phialemonium thermophilum TaxID=223376 RepID=A0ABR3VVL9_9PEZI